jgi:predicted transcriptional regulator
MSESSELSRRERQIMDVVYARGDATANEVVDGLSDAPTRTAVRTFLRILEHKGHLRHIKRGREFVYLPTRGRKTAGRSAFQRVLRTFFEGSLEKAVAAHLADPAAAVSPKELRLLSAVITEARLKEEP